MTPRRDRLAVLEAASAALAALVRSDSPGGLSLAEIALRWGEGISDEQREALEAFERQEAK